MPFLLSRPDEPFGAWLRRAAKDTPAGETAAAYGADIADQARPADVRTVLAAQGAPPAAREVFMQAVRDWLAASIPLDFDAVNEEGHEEDNAGNLIVWPQLEGRAVHDAQDAEFLTCVLCGELSFELQVYYVVALFPGEESFVCRACAPAIPGGRGAWELAEFEFGYKHREEGGQ
jgi:hypothetical protein